MPPMAIAPGALTHFKDFDVKFPSLGDKAIVFENGGWIYRFDLDTQKAEKVGIRILEDKVLAPARSCWRWART